MKSITQYIKESSDYGYDLNLEIDPSTQAEDYVGGYVFPNIPDLIKRLGITKKDIVDEGSKWVIVDQEAPTLSNQYSEDNGDYYGNLTVNIVNYSYGPGEEQDDDYSTLKAKWDNATEKQKERTVKELQGIVRVRM